MPVDVVGATQVILSKYNLGWLLFTMAHDGIHVFYTCLHTTLYMYLFNTVSVLNNLKFKINLSLIMF